MASRPTRILIGIIVLLLSHFVVEMHLRAQNHTIAELREAVAEFEKLHDGFSFEAKGQKVYDPVEPLSTVYLLPLVYEYVVKKAENGVFIVERAEESSFLQTDNDIRQVLQQTYAYFQCNEFDFGAIQTKSQVFRKDSMTDSEHLERHADIDLPLDLQISNFTEIGPLIGRSNFLGAKKYSGLVQKSVLSTIVSNVSDENLDTLVCLLPDGKAINFLFAIHDDILELRLIQIHYPFEYKKQLDGHSEDQHILVPRIADIQIGPLKYRNKSNRRYVSSYEIVTTTFENGTLVHTTTQSISVTRVKK